jgi:plastocyanin
MMRLRRLPLVAAPIVLALAAAPAPVSAATVTVGINNANNTFVKKSETIALGDSIQFTNDPALFPAAGLAGGPGQHNVAWDAGGFATRPSVDGSAEPWTFIRPFTKPGRYRYYCTLHGSPGGVDMAGRVLVRNADGSLPDVTPPALGRASATPGRGLVTLKFRSSEAGKATGTIKLKGGRGFKKFGDLAFAVKQGNNSIAVRRTRSGRSVGTGAFQVTFTVADAAGNRSSAKTLKFTISR